MKKSLIGVIIGLSIVGISLITASSFLTGLIGGIVLTSGCITSVATLAVAFIAGEIEVKQNEDKQTQQTFEATEYNATKDNNKKEISLTACVKNDNKNNYKNNDDLTK